MLDVNGRLACYDLGLLGCMRGRLCPDGSGVCPHDGTPSLLVSFGKDLLKKMVDVNITVTQLLLGDAYYPQVDYVFGVSSGLWGMTRTPMAYRSRRSFPGSEGSAWSRNYRRVERRTVLGIFVLFPWEHYAAPS